MMAYDFSAIDLVGDLEKGGPEQDFSVCVCLPAVWLRVGTKAK